jgi:hemoglobin
VSGNATSGQTIIINGAPLPAGLDEQMIHDVVYTFYEEIRRDGLLGPVFQSAIALEAWPHHLQKMCDFWSGALLRTARYEGRPLPPHLAIQGLGEMHFRRWLSLFRTTVRRICTPEVADLFMSLALRVAQSFRLAIAFHRRQDTLAIEPILESSL